MLLRTGAGWVRSVGAVRVVVFSAGDFDYVYRRLNSGLFDLGLFYLGADVGGGDTVHDQYRAGCSAGP